MSFFSRFPFFDKDEIAPDQINVQENVDIDFGRVVARLSMFAPMISRFLFGRGDGGGRLFISNAHYDNPNAKYTTVLSVAGIMTLLSTRLNRQIVIITNETVPSMDVYAGSTSEPVYHVILFPGDTAVFQSFTGAIFAVPSGVGLVIGVYEA